MQREDARIDLLECALLIAKHAYPDLVSCARPAALLDLHEPCCMLAARCSRTRVTLHGIRMLLRPGLMWTCRDVP